MRSGIRKQLKYVEGVKAELDGVRLSTVGRITELLKSPPGTRNAKSKQELAQFLSNISGILNFADESMLVTLADSLTLEEFRAGDVVFDCSSATSEDPVHYIVLFGSLKLYRRAGIHNVTAPSTAPVVENSFESDPPVDLKSVVEVLHPIKNQARHTVACRTRSITDFKTTMHEDDPDEAPPRRFMGLRDTALATKPPKLKTMAHLANMAQELGKKGKAPTPKHRASFDYDLEDQDAEVEGSDTEVQLPIPAPKPVAKARSPKRLLRSSTSAVPSYSLKGIYPKRSKAQEPRVETTAKKPEREELWELVSTVTRGHGVASLAAPDKQVEFVTAKASEMSQTTGLIKMQHAEYLRLLQQKTPTRVKEKETFLRSIPSFATCGNEEILHITHSIREVSKAKGEYLFRAGELLTKVLLPPLWMNLTSPGCLNLDASRVLEIVAQGCAVVSKQDMSLCI
ncbi:hypothetical protein CYMTET_52781 [Cymbomonas tetramitiformis]|uniref:Uncharacterized protein n=1 Tax=Cymbomonas tetramitiformis TaxID=36881 RepID=A0AAE0ESE1_9CHLO|nr:hypothetical protein CYMTET_52781 [Cymbomonas tetramitiformis]